MIKAATCALCGKIYKCRSTLDTSQSDELCGPCYIESKQLVHVELPKVQATGFEAFFGAVQGAVESGIEQNRKARNGHHV